MNVRNEIVALYEQYVAHGTPSYITKWSGSAYTLRAICEAFMQEYPAHVCSTVYGDQLQIEPVPGERATGVRISNSTPDTDYTNFRLSHADNGLAKVIKNLQALMQGAENGNVAKATLRKQMDKIIHELSNLVQTLEDE